MQSVGMKTIIGLPGATESFQGRQCTKKFILKASKNDIV